MVSPTPTISQPPVLSYAESAKKAQSVKSATQHTQKPLSNPPRQPPAPAPVPEPKKPEKPCPTVGVTQISLADLSLHDAYVPDTLGANSPSHTSAGESPAHVSSTREVAAHGPPSASVVAPSQPPPAKSAPVPNVWNQRIQQRAQARSQPRPPQSHPQTVPSQVPHGPSPPQNPVALSSGSRQSDVMASASVRSTQNPPLSPSLNGASSSTSSGPSTRTTPSSRKEPTLSPNAPPLATEADSWPEVGKNYVPFGKSQRVGNGHMAAAEERDAEEKDIEAPSSSHPGTPRKSASFSFAFTSLQVYFPSLRARVFSVSCSFPMLGAYNIQPLLFCRSSS